METNVEKTPDVRSRPAQDPRARIDCSRLQSIAVDCSRPTSQAQPPLRLLLVLPDGRIHKLRVGPLHMSFREAPLTLTTLAALVPDDLSVSTRLADESVDSVPFEETFDLVGISCLTGTSRRAYQIADRFRRAGATVVLGGVHVSLRPDEARCHANSIVTGFAETVWPQLLRDFAAGRLQPVYEGGKGTVTGLPLPRRDLQRRFGYVMPNTVLATRGCRGGCEFCTVPAVPFGWQTRPVHEVIDDIRSLPGTRFAFSDVSLVEDRDYALELFAALTPLRKKWGGLCTTRVGNDDELLQAMADSGCSFLLIGFESVVPDALPGLRKAFNHVDAYKALMAKLHALGITVQGCFIFGTDNDQRDVFERTVQMVEELKIDIPRYAIFTPYPGTRAYHRLRQEGRLLHEDWQFYDTQHVVFEPANMSPEQLHTGFVEAYRQTYRLDSVLRRTLGAPQFPITFVGNLAYRLYIRRLQRTYAAQHLTGFGRDLVASPVTART